ncbi:ABC transporter permease [Mesobaculum littorinae]|uniref:ABC transporter permease n=1 Tax=Mesobaculum littorinae TaxID=2486419 RepID=A0A438ALE4_9RHOB|nr:FtsX-like permease family protein [Mesobaculum littorinae]RVV99568.1 ABC transporter permease [Mesobaculum littorinae]
MNRAALMALVSHWRRRPLQLLTLVLGLATATALWSGVQAINAEARDSYDAAAQTVAGAGAARLVARGGQGITREDFAVLRRAGWPVTPVIEGRIDTPAGPMRVTGIDPFTLGPGMLGGAESSEATEIAYDPAFLTPPGLILAAPETARALEGGTGEGTASSDATPDKVLREAEGPERAELPPVRAVAGLAPGTLVVDLSVAARLLGNAAPTALILTGPVPDLEDHADDDRGAIGGPIGGRNGEPVGGPGGDTLADLAPGLRLQTPQGNADISRLTDSFHLNLTAFGLLAFAVGLFIVRGAVGLAFEQRRGVFRTLRALGLPLRRLLVLLLAELLILAVFAGLLGVALGWLLASALLPDVAATLRGLYGAEVAGTLTLSPAWWLSGLGVAVAGTLLAAGASLWQVARLPVLAPAQPRAWAMAGVRGAWLQAAGALALLVLALGLGLWGRGLVAGFAMLGALMLGAALCLPLILRGALRLGARGARGPVAQWFWADTGQQVPGLSLALMALLLALAANIGVGTMVASFRLTFTGWLDQRLAAELYVSSTDPAEAGAMRDWLAPRTRAILPIVSTGVTLGGRPGELYGVADDATYRDNWPILTGLSDLWDQVAAGQGVVINEQLSRAQELAPGDTLPVAGEDWQVAGVYSDYGNPLPQVLMGMDAFATRYPDITPARFGLRLPPGDAPALADALRDRYGSGVEIVDQRALKAESLRIFERTFTVTGALNVLTLSVAGFAILTSLLTLAGMRLPQLAPVWALGLTRRRLAMLELGRAVMLAALTALAALPLGLALAYVLLAVINVEAFGWRLPMHLFPLDWLRLFALACLAGAVASLWPARRIATLPPGELLKVFASER